MSFPAFLETAWSEHTDHPQEVADRLAQSLHRVTAAVDIAPFVHLLTHVFGEHLGQWQGGVDVLESLRRTPAFDGAAEPALNRSIAALRYAGGDDTALASLSVPDRVWALAAAASALAGRVEFTRALAAFAEALRLASAGLPSGSPAVRALAVAGNNLAAALEEKTDRDAGETQAMVTAAEAGLRHWKLAGTWLEEERAEYRLARSLLHAGEPVAAMQSAGRCLELCQRNDAPAFEQFFGYAVLALAQRAAGDHDAFSASRRRAWALREQVPVEERPWCETELEELGG